MALTAASCSDLGIDGGQVRSAAAPIRAAEPSPRVTITSPERASFHGLGTLTVRGEVAPVESASPIDSVFVQGAPVALGPDGSFEASVTLDPGLNLLRVEASDTRGRLGVSEVGVLAGEWAPLNQPIPEALGVRLSNPALDAVASIVEPIAAAYDPTPLTQAPIYDGSLLGGSVRARVDLANPAYRLEVPARVYAAADGLHVEVTARDLSVDVAASGSVLGVGVAEAAVVRADAATVAVTLALSVEPDRQVAVRVASSSVDVVAFQATATTSTLMNAILPLLQGWIERAVESQLASRIASLGGALNGALQEVLNPSQAPEIFGVAFPYATRGESVVHDAQGLELLLEFDAPPAQLSARAAAAPGSFSTPALTSPNLSGSRGVSIVLDDDMLNRLLHSVWASRGLDRVVAQLLDSVSVGGRPITARDAARFVPQVLLAVSRQATLSFQVEVALPPLLEVTGAPDLARLSLGEIHVTVFADDGAGPLPLGTFAVSLRAGVEVALAADGIRLSSNRQLPEISVDVLDEPQVAFDRTQIRMIVGSVAPLLLPRAIDAVGLVPIPSLVPPGTLRNLDASQDGPLGQRLRLDLDMLR